MVVVRALAVVLAMEQGVDRPVAMELVAAMAATLHEKISMFKKKVVLLSSSINKKCDYDKMVSKCKSFKRSDKSVSVLLCNIYVIA